ncbi:putative RNase H domain protein [Rosellinia necatrix]|uniref:Ribonuclease H n=1 Tax=Rosellinia necatrix TaxID=77044 RepID=A0A1W2TNY1_ROSNE|nr:putative RNase H domain protein [Rosellinia necatrix]
MPTNTTTKKEKASKPSAKPNAKPNAKSNAKPTTSTAANPSKKRKMDANLQKYYAVRAGNEPGVYLTWAECQEQTAGFRGASYKSFTSRDDAEAFVAGKKTSAAADGEEKFYAVAVGREPGIYLDWDEASLAIKGWKAPKYKKFGTRGEAIEFIRTHGSQEAQDWLLSEGEPPNKKAKKTKASNEPRGDILEDEPDVLRIFTDGSSLANGRAGATAGVGVFFGEDDERNVSERLTGETQTNQRAELTAVARALELSKDDPKIRIITDSKYAISCSTQWYKAWMGNDWKKPNGAEVLNQDLIRQIRALIDERDEADFATLFQWVKGHSSSPGNIAADKLAVAGAKKKR